MARLLAKDSGMIGKDHVVAGLIEKRRELAGIIDQMQRQLDQQRGHLQHLDAGLAIDLLRWQQHPELQRL